MAIVRKFTIGVAPFQKMFRIHGRGGEAVDAVLRLRNKGLDEDYFTEVGSNSERTVYKVTSEDQHNLLQLSEDSIQLAKDYYGSTTSFDFKKVLDEFRLIWGALNGVLQVQDVRRIGMVAEYRYRVEDRSASAWLRAHLTKFPARHETAKFHMRLEERELASDGKLPDPKKADFINFIYTFYDSSSDAVHPTPGHVDVDLDVQRYFTPLLSGSVADELLKLKKHFDPAVARLDEHLKSLGLAHGKK